MAREMVEAGVHDVSIPIATDARYKVKIAQKLQKYWHLDHVHVQVYNMYIHVYLNLEVAVIKAGS